MIVVIGTIISKPDSIDAVRAEGIGQCMRSRAEPGCLSHNVHEDSETPGKFVFVEYWADGDALKTHFAEPETTAFVQRVSPLALEIPPLEIYRSEQVKPSAL